MARLHLACFQQHALDIPGCHGVSVLNLGIVACGTELQEKAAVRVQFHAYAYAMFNDEILP